jgi:hypothetical protein
LVVRAHWNGNNGPPPSRWIVGRMREWSDEEGEALTAEMERRIAAKERPTGAPTSPQMQDKLRQMTDAELLAAGWASGCPDERASRVTTPRRTGATLFRPSSEGDNGNTRVWETRAGGW